MTRNERIDERNKRIRSSYNSLKGIKEFNVSKHSYQWIIANLSDKYCLAGITIERIILKTK